MKNNYHRFAFIPHHLCLLTFTSWVLLYLSQLHYLCQFVCCFRSFMLGTIHPLLILFFSNQCFSISPSLQFFMMDFVLVACPELAVFLGVGFSVVFSNFLYIILDCRLHGFFLILDFIFRFIDRSFTRYTGRNIHIICMLWTTNLLSMSCILILQDYIPFVMDKTFTALK